MKNITNEEKLNLAIIFLISIISGHYLALFIMELL